MAYISFHASTVPLPISLNTALPVPSAEKRIYAFLPGAELYNALATSGVTVDLQQTPWLNGCGIPKSRRADPRAEAGRL